MVSYYCLGHRRLHRHEAQLEEASFGNRFDLPVTFKTAVKNSAQILGEGSNQQPPKLRTPTQSSTPLQWLNATTSVVIENSIVKIFLNAL